tara:strand:- start:49 stop:291 length:243 start_codon:yes stop_codon:yes gene_type:complete
MNELINLMYQIKDLSTRTNEIALMDLQPRLMAVYDKLEIERLSICDVSQQRGLLLSYEEWLNEYNKLEDREKQVDKYLAK